RHRRRRLSRRCAGRARRRRAHRRHLAPDGRVLSRRHRHDAARWLKASLRRISRLTIAAMKGLESTERAEGRPPRRRARRAAGIVLAVLFGGALAFLGGFAAFASHVARLTTPAEQPDADAIIVLTGGEKRLDAAVDLLNSGKGRRLLISGVHPAAGLSDLQRATGGDARLFRCCVDIDHAALDTIGNAEESAKWVTSHAYDSVIIVTNN